MKTIEQIIVLGSAFYSVPIQTLVGPRRTERVALVRFSLMVACRQYEHTLVAIGDAFNRDHGTVMWALKNAIPEKFGSLWKEHMVFLDRVRVEPDDHDALVYAEEGLINSIAKIDEEIARLQRARMSLLEARLKLQPASKTDDIPT